ncbi:MAG: phosphogluconate dehydrogenase (NADP(+)-dependent, decarboxylating) [Pyrinomonas sp.]|uniref:NADP-dependent phosphogluconate dehydrogenase n=1 Tax=Pyrinomonas sp. TaxID=2080306 RepID=UPI003328CC66
MTKPAAEIGIVGLGVMGSNLALNIERHGHEVAAWERDKERARAFAAQEAAGKRIAVFEEAAEFVSALQRPRRILMMVKAGPPVDWTIEQFVPFLEPGDILIDGGNSFFQDTRRREAELAKRGLQFVGMGVSGGERGALHGPSLMPGGPRPAYDALRHVLEEIAAKTEDGPCVTYVGPDGAGHFVKMVHNGIEYGVMQLIAEAYDLMRRALGMEADAVAETFARWNQGPLQSFLIEITAKIFRVKDRETGRPLVELVLDRAEQKGTGKWTTQVALDLGVATPTINAGVEARLVSSLKSERLRAAKLLPGETLAVPEGDLLSDLHDALLAAEICAYAQGMNLIRTASDEYGWDVRLREIARTWKGGCIIRARLLDLLKGAYERHPQLENVLLDEEVARTIAPLQKAWRRVVIASAARGVSCPALAASLAYFDAYRTERLPQNLTQAQRDLFGAHTYERIDHPERGHIHTDWEEEAERAARSRDDSGLNDDDRNTGESSA